jgi:hypothetical protein
MYVDDMVGGASTEEEAFQLYTESKKILSQGGFHLRKFVTNSSTLHKRIQGNENLSCPESMKVLGIQWDVLQDELVKDIANVITEADTLSPTKRTVVSAISQFYDRIGLLTPVTITFKVFLQDVTKANVEWDQPLAWVLLERWKALVFSLQRAPSISIPRSFLYRSESSCLYYLRGFCDASITAYAAVIYLVSVTGEEYQIKFVTSKT